MTSQTLVSAFAAQARRQGARTAITDDGQALSYAELAERSDRLARTLRTSAGVERGSVVGIAAGRSAELIVAMLAALKSGAAYLPLDPSYPAERLRFMVVDSGAAAVVVEPDLSDRLARFIETPLVPLGGGEASGAAPEPLPEPKPDDAAYVVYTSGTTGDPKGVVVEHRNVTGLFEASRHFGFGPDDVWSQFHSASFDFSVWEIWGALLHGGRLAIVPSPVVEDPELFASVVAQEKITVLSQTPSAFRGLADTTVPFPSLRLAVLGGEPVDLRAVEHWLSTRGEATQLINMYGITETTVHVTELPLTPELCSTWQGPGSPIGRPLPGASIRLVDRSTGEPSEPGETGEIWVGGFGVARGYLNRPGLTDERFVVDDAGVRMYRSGDLGRSGPDGRLAHLGRMDDQVKVRGFRIELAEVESALDRLPGVAKSAVTVQGSGAAATLVAFVVPQREHAPAVLELLSRSTGNGNDRQGRLRFMELPNGVELAHANPGETRFLYDEVYVRHAYCRHGIAIPDNACVLDVGANIGMFSLWAAEQASDVTVVAFEPLPPTFALLRTNLALHGSHARALPYGVGARDEEATFYYFPHDTIFSGRYPGDDERFIVGELLRREPGGFSTESIAELLDDRLRTVAYRCRIRRLSDVIADLGIDRIDLLKIDVEKAELEVFAGIDDSDWPLIDQIAIEVHGEETVRRVVPELERRGFSVVAEEDARLRGVGLTNVYARRSRRSPPRHTPQLPRFRGRPTMVQSLRDAVTEVLPPYAAPSRIELVPELPLTANGKIDRAALTVPEDQSVPDAAAELTPHERVVASVFESVLGRPVVSPNANFFELGGQSLIGIEAVRRLRTAFGCDLPIALLFQRPRVSDLAAAIVERTGDSPVPAATPPEPRRAAGTAGPAPLTDAELSLWAFQDLFPDSSALNVARDITIGRPYGEDVVEALRESLGRHPSLRACFVENGEEIRRLVRDVCIAPCRISDFSDDVLETLAGREVNRPFDLATEVPIRVFVGPRSPRSTRILIVMHHIATDGSSMRALVHECVAALAGERRPRAAVSEGPLPSREDSDAYWHERLEGLAPLPLPDGRAREPWPSLAADSIERLLSDLDVEPIAVDGATVTPHAYLLSCFAASLQAVLGTYDAAIGVPCAGRMGRGDDDLGCFVTMAPIRIPSSADDLVPEIQRQLVEVIDRGSPSAAAERRSRIVDVPPGNHPLFQVTFSYHDAPLDESFGVGGVDASVRELRPAELQFDLSLTVAPTEHSGWSARLEFRTSSFSHDVAGELLDAFVHATADARPRAIQREHA